MKASKITFYSLVVLLGTILFVYLAYRDHTMLYDDAYSIFMTKKSFADILSITSKDVHPPLYYWMLKTFSIVFGDSVFALRLFSTLGVFATLLLGCFPVRRLFGDRVALSFLLLVILFPVTQYLATDIRMYSWTMFFVLACALYAYQIYIEGSRVQWLLFFLTGVCAAYLHNYGLLSVLGIYLLLFIFLLKETKKRYCFFIYGVLFAFAYAPWLYQLVQQVGEVSQDYWIKPLTLNDLFLHIYYFYSPKEVWLPFTDFTKGQMMGGLIFLMAIQLILTLKVIISGWRDKDNLARMAVYSFVAFLFPVIVGFAASVLFFPMIVTRYMTCSFGLFALSLAFVLAKVYGYPKYRFLFYFFMVSLFLDMGIRYYSGLKYYEETDAMYQDVRDFLDSDDWQNKDIVTNDFSYYIVPRLQLIFPDKSFSVLDWDNKLGDLSPFVIHKIENISSDEFILTYWDRDITDDDFKRYKEMVQTNYMVVDSLQVSDIYFYKMKLQVGE